MERPATRALKIESAAELTTRQAAVTIATAVLDGERCGGRRRGARYASINADSDLTPQLKEACAAVSSEVISLHWASVIPRQSRTRSFTFRQEGSGRWR